MDRPELASIIEAKFACYVARVIKQIKRLPKEGMQSGDDSPLRSVWEEFVVQCRGQESILYDLYEETIRQICRGVASRLPEHEQGLLWLWTDEYVAWEEEETVPYGEFLLEALENELFKRLSTHILNMDLPERLERYIDPAEDA